MSELHQLTAAESSERMAQGRLTSETLVEACLARVAERESVTGAFEHLDPAKLREAARAADRAQRKSALHGVPVAVKDVIETADQPTTYGSVIFAGHYPKQDAACVARLRALGAIPFGKTVTTEFANFHPGKTTNPHNPAHTPGGSSSGSAAAVADLMVPLAFGTQTAGSVLRPAAYCGIVGFKGTYGWFPTDGICPLAKEYDTLGLFARSVADIKLFRRAMAGDNPIEPAAPAAPRLALVRTRMWGEAEKAAQAMLEAVARRLAAAGAVVRELTLPFDDGELTKTHDVLMAVGCAEAHGALYERERDRLKYTRVLIENGRATKPEVISAGRAAFVAARAAMKDVFAGCDAILTLASPGEAPKGLAFTGPPIFNRVWTGLYVPCIALPYGRGDNNLPLGLQLVGAHGEDAKLLALAAWAEARLG
jgi:amidase